MNEAGTYAYAGSTTPSDSCIWNTFSVGVFQWIAKAHDKGVKKGKVQVRVSGPTSKPELVYAKAQEIVDHLTKGTYVGPKRVTVKL